MSTADRVVNPPLDSGFIRRERIIERFETAWRRAERPVVEDFLPARADDRRDVLIELVHVELELRLRAGEATTAKEYLERYPEIAGDAGIAAGLLAVEETVRRRSADVDRRSEAVGRRSDDAPVRLDAHESSAGRGTDSQLGKFELLEEVGRGAFGIVYRARDRELDRIVAVKLPRSRTFSLTGGTGSSGEAQRFLREARTVARLKHPHIVPVLEAGQIDGTLYLVSEFIEGGTLAARLAEGPPSPRESAELVARIALALEHAHRQGIVHRDLKPSNILLDRLGQPHITDFGLAKQEAAETILTVEGDMLGTPAYLSPEQARGDGHLADARTDVYSLGVILYQLLTGELPFRGNARMLVQQVLQDEPRAPRRLNDRVPRDLEVICLKAMAKEPARRYASARELAEDLAHFLAGEPIRARPVRAWRRGWIWARRRPVVALLCALVVVVAASGFGGVTWQWRRAELARRNLESNLYLHLISLADRELAAGNIGRSEEILDQCAPRLRGWEWYHLQRRRRQEPLVLRGHTHRVAGVAFSPDARLVASAGWDGTVRLWDSSSGRQVRVLAGHTGFAHEVAFSPDGARLASCAGDETARIWDVATGKELLVLRHKSSVWSLAFSPDGARLVTSSADGLARIWDALSGSSLRTLRGHGDRVWSVRYSPDGAQIASADAAGLVLIWDAATGRPLRTLREGLDFPIKCVAFSPDGSQLACASDESVVKIWEVATGRLVSRLVGNFDSVWGVAYSPDGRRIASAGGDRGVKIWDVSSGREVLTLRGHTDMVWGVAFSRDGHRIVSGSWDGTVRVWDATPDDGAGEKGVFVFRGHDRCVRTLAYSPDGRRLASGGDDGTVRIWDPATGRVQLELVGHTSGILAVAFRPDGRQAASCGWDRTIRLWDLASGRETRVLRGHASTVIDVAFDPSGAELASASFDGTARVWNVDTGEERLALRGHDGYVYALHYSQDGTRLATAGGDGIRVWDPKTGAGRVVFNGSAGVIRQVVFDRSGERLAAASENGVIQIWDVRSGRELSSLRGHGDRATGVSFSPDGRRIASSSWDRTVRVWDVSTGKELRILRGHSDRVICLDFSPDGAHLASAGGDRTIRVWDLTDLSHGLSSR